MRNVLLAPSILSADFSRLGDELKAIEEGGADWVHIDVMDGHFVPNITVGPVVVKWMRRHSRLPFDVHLMISHPAQYIKAFADAGADYITIHVEAEDDLSSTLKAVRALGKKAGVSVNPATPLEAVRGVLGDVDLLLVMTVQPGFAGQKFRADVVPKVREARGLVDAGGLRALVEVDGGVTTDNAGLVFGAGADVLVAGSAVFCGKGTVAQELAALRAACVR